MAVCHIVLLGKNGVGGFICFEIVSGRRRKRWVVVVIQQAPKVHGRRQTGVRVGLTTPIVRAAGKCWFLLSCPRDFQNNISSHLLGHEFL